MVAKVDAAEVHHANVHSLELEMIAGEEYMEKAELLEVVDNAVELHDENAHRLEQEMVAGDEDM